MAGHTRIFSCTKYIPSAKNHLDIPYPCITTFLAISICLALLDTWWKFDRTQELDAFQWWILPFLNYNLLSINSSFITVLHKRRKSNPLVKALKWQPPHSNDQRGFVGPRQTMTTEKPKPKDWNDHRHKILQTTNKTHQKCGTETRQRRQKTRDRNEHNPTETEIKANREGKFQSLVRKARSTWYNCTDKVKAVGWKQKLPSTLQCSIFMLLEPI